MEIGKCWSDAVVDDEKESRDVMNGKAAYIDNCVDNSLLAIPSLNGRVAVKHW